MEMKDNLEEWLKANKNQLDELEPNPMVWYKIESTLPQARPTKKEHRLWPLILKVASGVVVILLIGIGLGYYLGNHAAVDINNANPILQNELKNNEEYFQKLVQKKLNDYEQVGFSNKQVINDIKQLDEIYLEMKAELRQVPASETDKIIKEMIQNYKTRISLLERVINKSNKSKNRHEENLDI